jgi:hypothetical protein
MAHRFQNNRARQEFSFSEHCRIRKFSLIIISGFLPIDAHNLEDDLPKCLVAHYLA